MPRGKGVCSSRRRSNGGRTLFLFHFVKGQRSDLDGSEQFMYTHTRNLFVGFVFLGGKVWVWACGRTEQTKRKGCEGGELDSFICSIQRRRKGKE